MYMYKVYAVQDICPISVGKPVSKVASFVLFVGSSYISMCSAVCGMVKRNTLGMYQRFDGGHLGIN